MNTQLSRWVLDFFTGRPQVIRMGRCVFRIIIVNAKAPQGCSPRLLHTLQPCCEPCCLIFNIDESAYLNELKNLTTWCQANCLQLNVSKTKELVVDYSRKQQRSYSPTYINRDPVEKVSTCVCFRLGLAHLFFCHRFDAQNYKCYGDFNSNKGILTFLHLPWNVQLCMSSCPVAAGWLLWTLAFALTRRTCV